MRALKVIGKYCCANLFQLRKTIEVESLIEGIARIFDLRMVLYVQNISPDPIPRSYFSVTLLVA